MLKDLHRIVKLIGSYLNVVKKDGADELDWPSYQHNFAKGSAPLCSKGISLDELYKQGLTLNTSASRV